MNYIIAGAILNGRSSKKLAKETYIHPTVAGIKLKYYDIDIIYFMKTGDILVDCNGLRLKTIKDRLNQFLPLCFQGIYSREGIWFWKDGKPFKDRTILNENKPMRVLQKATNII